MTANTPEQQVPASNSPITPRADITSFLKVLATLAPFLPFVAALHVSFPRRNSPSDEAFLGTLSLASFSWFTIAFSLVSIILLTLTLQRAPQFVLHLFNSPFRHDVLALTSSNDDGRSERAEALTIMAVFIFFLTTFAKATGNPVALFTTTLGSAATALMTLQFLTKLGLSMNKKYRFRILN